ncbi:MAG: hypothetical protein GY722_12270 [bacterium]|nr:hypothetical protein [bacterium]
MPRPKPAVCVGFVGLVLATIAVASDADATFGLRAEQAVIQGSVVKMQALRSSLERDPSPDHYNLAYLDWRQSQLLPDNARKEKRRLLKRAQKHLEILLETDPDNAEAYALRGSAIGERITGMWSGMRLGRKASASLNRGVELGSDNPRVALQRGISFFFTPKSFGGGLPRAEQELRRALRLFAKEPSATPWPNWGRVDVRVWLGQTLAKV